MQNLFTRTQNSIEHIKQLHDVFSDSSKHPIYKENYDLLVNSLSYNEHFFEKQLYGSYGRQMILADVIEYIFIGRGYYFVTSSKNTHNSSLSEYMKIILYFVNLLMYYESMTVDVNDRKNFLTLLKNVLPPEEDLNLFNALFEYEGKIGLPDTKIPDSDFIEIAGKYGFKDPKSAKKQLNSYFDKLLPKTAGGLWHELLVYVFLLRYEFGHVIPLLLTQRFLHGTKKHLVPPDFLLIANDKKIYGIEVGIKKEIQSGSFSIESGIPTATIDTLNSRSSDRCPICNKWILFCENIIEDFTDFNYAIEKSELKCLDDCRKFERKEISDGICPYTKYRRERTKTKEHTHHEFANNLHYHYQCILQKVEKSMEEKIKNSEDSTALKTHFPYYQGLESLFPKKN